jgi:copper(I)-binding protein
LGCGEAAPAEGPPNAASDRSGDAAGLQIHDAVVASLGDGSPGALYFVVANTGSVPDTLVAIETASAESAELHHSAERDGIRSMEPVAELVIPAGAQVRLEPGGFHVMLIDLTDELVPGDTIEVTAVFGHAGRVSVRARAVSYFELADGLGDGDASSHAGH